MKNRQQNTSLLRRILTVSVVLCFVFFLLVFIQQYMHYKRIEDRLTAAYSTSYKQSAGTYKLLSTFSEADNLFRLYTVDYSEDAYEAYRVKLDTIKIFVDSIANIPIDANPMAKIGADLQSSQNYATEFANLRRDINALVFYAIDSLVELHSTSTIRRNSRISRQNADSIVNKILQDTLVAEFQDTVVHERKNLFDRIFRAKNDTVVTTNKHEVLSQKQIDIVHRNIDHFLEVNENVYRNNLAQLRRAMLRMQNKERLLVTSNYNLLHNLKTGLDRLKQMELEAIRASEARDFAIYKQNFDQFGMQLIAAAIIMLLMLIFILYYYYKTSSFENRLFLEKEYASKLAEEKTDILANVSHEVRTPLNSLQGIIDILKKNNTGTIDSEIIQTVNKDITVINNTLNDILSLSKLEAESLDIKMEFFSPYQLIEEVIALHRHPAKIKKLKYSTTNKVDENIVIKSNSFRIRQILSNIISNAIKYTAKGSVTIDTELSEVDHRHMLRVRVRDTGVGIATDKKDQVFRKYYVADSKVRSGGFGLGLYISKLLSQQIGGQISFTSKQGEGSIFTFELPIDKKNLRIDKLRHYSLDDISDDIEVVIIEDSRISLFFVQQLFKDKKNVHIFQSAAQAWNHIQHAKVDVVITDLVMPGINGWDLLERIKSSVAKAHIRVFVATAEPMLLEEKVERRYHFDGIIAKPIQEEAIAKAIVGP